MNQIEKIPPQATEIEEVILGALMISSDSIKKIKEILPVEAFYKDVHGTIYRAMLEIENSGNKIDLLTVAEHLKSTGKLDEIGGATFISNLTSRVASASHIEEHSTIVYEKWIAREVIRLGHEMIDGGFADDDPMETIQEVKNKLEHHILHFLGIISTGINIQEAVEKSIDDYYTREKNIREGKVSGIPTSLKSLNRMTGGFQPGQLIILAGRPGMGKTSLAISFLLTAARYGKKCAFFSLEMSAERLTDKIICSICNISFGDFKKGKLSDQQKDMMETAGGIIEDWNIRFNDDMIVKVEKIHATCSTIKDRQGLDLIFIDYLQLMGTTEKTGNREQEVSTMSRKCKQMAVDLGVPVVLMSQLNRSVESRGDKRPLLSDLRESGGIEQDADIVLFVYREIVYNTESPNDRGELIVAKHREGSTGIIDFKHNESLTLFSDPEDLDASNIDLYSKESKEMPF